MITPSEAKQIRRSLGLSQKEVSAQTSLCNTDISKFECGKLIMKSTDLRNLSNYYKDQMKAHSPFQLNENEISNDNGPEKAQEQRYINGILVPESFDEDEALDLMDMYQVNQKNVSEALKNSVERGLFGGLVMDSVIRDVLVPMAHNYSIISLIQGTHEVSALEKPESKYLSQEENIETMEDVIRHLFATPYTTA
jgi:transcriptional regulator with XRE-family HTH domain